MQTNSQRHPSYISARVRHLAEGRNRVSLVGGSEGDCGMMVVLVMVVLIVASECRFNSRPNTGSKVSDDLDDMWLFCVHRQG